MRLLPAGIPERNAHSRCRVPHKSMHFSRRQLPRQDNYLRITRTPDIYPGQPLLSKKKVWAHAQFA
jgi:hypothetical protein